MKNALFLFVILILLFSFCSCFLFGHATTHPDMVEYREEEVLELAKDKYGITEWLFTGTELRGEAAYDAEGSFCLDFYDDRFSTELVGGDNIESAMQAFAGKNGNHDIQGMYSRFLCCIALGKCEDGSLKFVYYNTNIHKDAEIADTIGASDYVFDVSPEEITNELFTVDTEWGDMQDFLDEFKDFNPRSLVYSGEHLIVRRSQTTYSYVDIEFYKENGEVVYDLCYIKDEDAPEERRIVYSTSERYGVIYNYYGADKAQYFDITQTVTQSPDEQNVMVLRGSVEVKPVDGTVLYSAIGYKVSHQELNDRGRIVEAESWDQVYDKLSFERGYGINKIDGVDHTETARFSVYDYYIFYEKNRVEQKGS